MVLVSLSAFADDGGGVVSLPIEDEEVETMESANAKKPDLFDLLGLEKKKEFTHRSLYAFTLGSEHWNYDPFWRSRRLPVLRSSRRIVQQKKPNEAPSDGSQNPGSTPGSDASAKQEVKVTKEEDAEDKKKTEPTLVFFTAAARMVKVASVSQKSLSQAIKDKGVSTYTLYGNEYVGKNGLGKLNSTKNYFCIDGNGHTISGTEGQNLALTINSGRVDVQNSTWIGFDDNKGGEVLGGVFQNRGELNISNSTFIGNNQIASSKGQNDAHGGVIANLGGEVEIVDSSFINNSVDRWYEDDSARGGAIYNNGGFIKIFACEKDVVFSGNKDGFGGNDIFSNGTLQLDARNGREMSFDGGIDSFLWQKNALNINTTGENAGTINFKAGSYVANQAITLGAGTLKIEDENSFAQPYVINEWNPPQYGKYTNSIEMTGGIIDIANNSAGTLYFETINGINGNAKIDIDLAAGMSDRIVGKNVIKQIEFTLEDINFIGTPATAKSEITLDLGNGLMLAPSKDNTVERDGLVYDVTSSGTSVTLSRWLTINDVVESPTELVWNACGNVAKDKVYRDLGAMAGTELTLNGGEFTISGRKNAKEQYSGIIVDDSQMFTVNGGTWQDFTSGFGGFLNNQAGTSVLNNVVVQNNTASLGGAIYNNEDAFTTVNGDAFIGNSAIGIGLGGAIYNTGDLTIVDTLFTGNHADVAGGAIYNDKNSTLNLIARDRDIVFFGNTMANGENNDIVNVDSTINMTVAADRKIIFGGGIQNSAGTININADYSGSGEVRFLSGSVNTNNLINLTAGTLTIEAGAEWVGGMIYVSDGAVVNSSGKINLQYSTDTAVHNSGLITLAGTGSELRQDGGFKNNVNGTLVITDNATWISTGLVENYSKDTIHVTGTTTGGITDGAANWNQQGAFINGNDAGTNTGSVIIDGGSRWFSDPATTAATVLNNLRSKISIKDENSSWSSTGTVTNYGTIEISAGAVWTSSADVIVKSGDIKISEDANWNISAGTVNLSAGGATQNQALSNQGTITLNGGKLVSTYFDKQGRIGLENGGTIILNNDSTFNAQAVTNKGTITASAGTAIMLSQNGAIILRNNANASFSLDGATLTATDVGGTTVKNEGTFTAKNSATLRFGKIDNTGTFLLAGAGTNLELEESSATVSSALTSENRGELTVSDNARIVANVGISNSGNMELATMANVTLQGAYCGDLYPSFYNSAFKNLGQTTVKTGAVLGIDDLKYAYDIAAYLVGGNEKSFFNVNDKFVIAAKAATDSVVLSRGAVIGAAGGITSVSGGNVTYGNDTGATIIASFTGGTDGNRETALISSSGSASVTLSSSISLVLTGDSAEVKAAMAAGAQAGKTFVKVMNLVSSNATAWSELNIKDTSWADEYSFRNGDNPTNILGQFESVWLNGISYAGVLGSDGYVYIAVPEPSLFGCFAGLAALVLAGTRRRRK